MKLAPDNKIYVQHALSGGFTDMSLINFPYRQGMDCQYEQNVLNTPGYYASTAHNIPNFRLGPLDGSDCDTLGIDNHPVAKFRYVQDLLLLNF